MSLLCSAWGLCVALLCTLYKAGPEALVCARDANCEQLWDSSQEIERRAEWGEEQEFLLLLSEKKSADNGQNVYFFSLSLYIFLIAIVLCCTVWRKSCALLETYFLHGMTSLNGWIYILGSPVNYPSSPCHNWHSESTEVSRQRAAVRGSSLSKGPLAPTKLFVSCVFAWQIRKRSGFLWLYCFANIFISGLASLERSCFGIFHIPLEHWTSFVSRDINSLEVP